MPHERLQRAGVYPAPGKGISCAVAKHVDVDGKGQSGGLAKPFNELLSAVDGQRCAASLINRYRQCVPFSRTRARISRSSSPWSP